MTAKSSLPVVRHAVHNEQLAADNRLDRMQIWMNSIESMFRSLFSFPTLFERVGPEVVEDARQTFASADMVDRPLPPLPISPISRSTSHSRANRSTRAPRKILAASQIFVHEANNQSMSTILTSAYATADSTNIDPNESLPLPKVEQKHFLELSPQTPRPRRATVSTLSPDCLGVQHNLDVDNGSPAQQEKSKSQANLIRHITPVLGIETVSRKCTFQSLSLQSLFHTDMWVWQLNPQPNHRGCLKSLTKAYSLRRQVVDLRLLLMSHFPSTNLWSTMILTLRHSMSPLIHLG
jgi:serine/threonine-protein kinase GIN4